MMAESVQSTIIRSLKYIDRLTSGIRYRQVQINNGSFDSFDCARDYATIGADDDASLALLDLRIGQITILRRADPIAGIRSTTERQRPIAGSCLSLARPLTTYNIVSIVPRIPTQVDPRKSYFKEFIDSDCR